jgi:hypothetical protein
MLAARIILLGAENMKFQISISTSFYATSAATDIQTAQKRIK